MAGSNWKRCASREETFAVAAKLIAEGHIIGWWRGRMEFGPHALGNRSILADPGHAAMLERINAMVKKREAFRPFFPPAPWKRRIAGSKWLQEPSFPT